MTRLLKNIMRGAGSTLDILPAPGRRQRDFNAYHGTDGQALTKDWEKVGGDLWKATKTVGRDVEEKQR